MVLKNKSMALIRIRKTPYSGLISFLQDIFFKDQKLAKIAYNLLKEIYSKGILSKDWRVIIKKYFEVSPPTSDDELKLDEACEKYLGFKRQNLIASKQKLRGKKAYKLLLEKDIDEDIRHALEKISKWNSAVASYYSILNKLKAIGLIEKSNGMYIKSDRFKKRLSQISDILVGFEEEINQI